MAERSKIPKELVDQIPENFRECWRVNTFGPAETRQDSLLGEAAYKVGELLADREIVDVNGGQFGTMEYTSEACNKAGGQVIGILRHERSSRNDFLTIPIRCDMKDDSLWPYTGGMHRRTGVLLMLGDGAILYFDFERDERDRDNVIFDPGTIKEYLATYEDHHNKYLVEKLFRPTVAVCDRRYLWDAQMQIVSATGQFRAVRDSQFDDWMCATGRDQWLHLLPIEHPDEIDEAVNWVHANLRPEVTRGT